MDAKQVDKLSEEKGLDAPRVDEAEFNGQIKDIEVIKHTSTGGSILRWAIVTLQNGFTVTGKPSVAVSVENDDDEIGRKIAIDNAKDNIWQFLGYGLKDKIFKEELDKARNTIRAVKWEHNSVEAEKLIDDLKSTNENLETSINDETGSLIMKIGEQEIEVPIGFYIIVNSLGQLSILDDEAFENRFSKNEG